MLHLPRRNDLDESGKEGGSSGSEKKQQRVALLLCGQEGEKQRAQLIHKDQARSCWKS